MGQVTGFFHGGITVRDMDRSLTFYRDGLGLDIVFDTVIDKPYLKRILGIEFEEMRVVYLRVPGGGFVELLEYRGIERMPARARPQDYGAGHFCLFVDGIDDIVTRLFEFGFSARAPDATEISAGPNKGAKGVYLFDPDGYNVELFQPPPGGLSYS